MRIYYPALNVPQRREDSHISSSVRTLSALTAFTLAATLANPLVAKSQTLPTPPETVIVITATRTPTPTTKVSTSETIITAKQLEATHQPFVLDALRLVPGLYVSQSGGPGTNVDLSIRGGSAGDTLVLIDGVPVNDPSSPDRSYDISTLSVDNIDRIEILRGAQSTLYGSNATAGVINIITKKGQGKPVTKATFDGGSYSTASGRVESAGSFGAWGYSASASQYYTAGYPLAALQPGDGEKDGFRDTTYSARLDKEISSSFALDITARYIRATDHYTGFGSLNNVTYIALDDGLHRYDSEQVVSRAQLSYKPNLGRFTSTAGVSVNTLNRDYIDEPTAGYSTIDPSSGPGNYNGRLYDLDWQANYLADHTNLFTAGAETEQERAQYDSAAYFEEANARSLTTGSGYVQDQLTFSPAWSGVFGARLDHHQEFGSQWTYHGGTKYCFRNSGTTLSSNYATGFKAPSLYDLYDPNYGNPNLRPETSETFDVGVDQSLLSGRAAVGATYFSDKYLELFSYNPLNFRTINIGSATTRGVELAFSYRVAKRLDADINYTYARARQDSGAELLRSPAGHFGGTIQYEATEALNFNLNAEYVGNRNDTNGTAEPVDLPGYTLINLAADYQLSPTYKVFAQIENLTNEDYQEVYSYQAQGRGIYGGVTAQL